MGFAIIFVLFLRFNPAEILEVILSVRISYLFAALFIYAVTLFLLSMRWRLILKKMGYQIPITVAYMGFTAGILLSDITPARIGELSRPFTIRDRVPVTVGLGSVFLDRYCDFIAIFALGFGGLLLLSIDQSTGLLLFMLFILSFPIGILSVFWFRRNTVLNLVHRSKILRLISFADSFALALDSVRQPRRTMGIAVTITLFVWILQSMRIILIAAAAGYYLPIQEMVFVQPLISALSLVPVSISGLGFVEGGYVTIFAHYGIPVATGLAIALLDRVLTVSFHFIVGIRYALRTIGNHS